MAPSSPAAAETHASLTNWKRDLSEIDRSHSRPAMRQLIRRLPRVGDCSSSPARRRGGGSKAHAGVPEGHVPVHVGGGEGGEAEERFVVRAELLGAPALAELLGRAAQEYGYHHQGPLRIPCPVSVFRRALASVAADQAAGDDEDGE